MGKPSSYRRKDASPFTALKHLADSRTTPERRHDLARQVHEYVFELKRDFDELRAQQEVLMAQQAAQECAEAEAEECTVQLSCIEVPQDPGGDAAAGGDVALGDQLMDALHHEVVSRCGSLPSLLLTSRPKCSTAGSALSQSFLDERSFERSRCNSARDSVHNMMDRVAQRMGDLLGAASLAAAETLGPPREGSPTSKEAASIGETPGFPGDGTPHAGASPISRPMSCASIDNSALEGGAMLRAVSLVDQLQRELIESRHLVSESANEIERRNRDLSSQEDQIGKLQRRVQELESELEASGSTPGSSAAATGASSNAMYRQLHMPSRSKARPNRSSAPGTIASVPMPSSGACVVPGASVTTTVPQRDWRGSTTSLLDIARPPPAARVLVRPGDVSISMARSSSSSAHSKEVLQPQPQESFPGLEAIGDLVPMQPAESSARSASHGSLLTARMMRSSRINSTPCCGLSPSIAPSMPLTCREGERVQLSGLSPPPDTRKAGAVRAASAPAFTRSSSPASVQAPPLPSLSGNCVGMRKAPSGTLWKIGDLPPRVEEGQVIYRQRWRLVRDGS